jgi:hypothetical protein
MAFDCGPHRPCPKILVKSPSNQEFHDFAIGFQGEAEAPKADTLAFNHKFANLTLRIESQPGKHQLFSYAPNEFRTKLLTDAAKDPMLLVKTT